MTLNSLHDLFVEQLKDMYSAEKQLVKALPKLAKAATSPALAEALTQHLAETRQHVKRLEKVFELADNKPVAKHCDGMEGLITEGDHATEEEGEPSLVDGAIVAAAQRVEHYEISAYGTLVHYAEMLDMTEAADLLKESLEEEKAADAKLSEVSDAEIWDEALEAGRGA